MAVSDLKNKAHEAFRRKRYEQATTIYLEYLQYQPNDEDSIEGFFNAARKAREHKGKGLFGGALSRVGVGSSKDPKKRMVSTLRALAKSPEDKKLLMALGEAALAAGAPNAGVAAYKRAADADKADAMPWKRLGEAYGRSGKIKEALDALSKAIDINPRDQEAVKLRKNLAAEGALKLSGYETAKSSRDLVKDKKLASELEVEARLQLTPEHAASEIDRLEGEIESNPDDARARVRLADLLLDRGDEAAALAALEEAARRDPENYELGVRVGDLRLRRSTREYKEAEARLEASPDDAEARAAAEAARQALVDARLAEHGRRVHERPLDLAERFAYGRWLLEAGRVDEALAEFQQTVRDPNRKVDSLRFQAACFERKSLVGLAVKKLEEAVAEFATIASPKAKEIHYLYADLLERKGDTAKARDVLEQIVEADAGYKDAMKRLEALSA